MSTAVGLVILAAVTAVRAASRPRQPAFKWLLPVALLTAAVAADTTPPAVQWVIFAVVLTCAAADVLWYLRDRVRQGRN
jgi:uncharacterized membrane protein YhhN